jgi:hypothetical protein
MKNAGELKATAALYVDREDLGPMMDTFIELTEAKIYRNLRTRENEFTLTITEETIPEPLSPIVLPDNFREFKLVTLNDTPIENVSPQRLNIIKGSGYQGPCTYFATIERKLVLFPWVEETPDEWDAFTLDLLYYGTESLTEMATWPTPTNPNMVPESDGTPANTTLRGDDATTRLFLVAQDVYLYGLVAEIYAYLLVPAKVAEWGGAFGAVLAELKKEGNRSEFSGSTVSVSSVGDNYYGRSYIQ